jgi:hypothetical protein
LQQKVQIGTAHAASLVLHGPNELPTLRPNELGQLQPLMQREQELTLVLHCRACQLGLEAHGHFDLEPINSSILPSFAKGMSLL